MHAARIAMPDLIERLDRLLPQTQCGQCGYAGCRPYAEAMATGAADVDRCPPGGDAGARALARLLGVAAKPYDRSRGEHKPPLVARDRRSRLHRLHQVHPGLPGGRDHRRIQADAYGDRAAVHGMRAVRAGVPGGLHRVAAGARRANRRSALEQIKSKLHSPRRGSLPLFKKARTMKGSAIAYLLSKSGSFWQAEQMRSTS